MPDGYYIMIDNYLGMKENVDHLIDVHGYKNIAFISGPKGSPSADLRMEAYLDSLEEHGMEIRREAFVDGKLDYVENVKEYDNGLLSRELENDDYGKTMYEHLYKYNDLGQVVQYVRNEVQNKDRRSYDYEYDERGNRVKELIYDYDNMLIAKKYNTYDEEGRLVMVEEEDLDNYRKVKLEYEGNLVVKNYLYERDDKLVGWAEYGYDDNGKEVSATEYIRDEVDPESHRLLRVTHFERG